jgi:hypothetical protein
MCNFAWQFAALLSGMLVAGTTCGQTHNLAETVREGECFRLSTETNLSGTLKVTRDGKAVPIRITAQNNHVFNERVLIAISGMPRKTARNYSTASAQATVDGERVTRSLAADRRLIVAKRTDESLFCFSPAGPLTRTDLEVVSEHFETLHLTGLLPGKAVAIGDTWKIDSLVAQALCLFEGLIAHDLTGKLREVTAGVAIVGIDGTAKGIENGAMVNLTVAANLRFDLATSRIVGVEWKQKDVRDQGPVSPAAEIETTTILKRELLAAEPAELNATALAQVPAEDELPAALKQLLHRDPKSRFQFLHARDWHVVGQTDHHLIMRNLERGEFIAQATLTMWQNAGVGKHMSPADFEKLTAQGASWKIEEVLDRTEIPTDADRWVYRITARGELDGSKVIQNFYVVATANGEQMILTFTMKPGAAPRLGTRDLALVNGIEFAKK